jgi:hypothetical protein
MPIDFDSMAPDARRAYIQTGERYGSEDTLQQADATLEGCGKYGQVIRRFGFGGGDEGDLKDARQALLDAGVQRAGASASRSKARSGFRDTQRRGKDDRQAARSVLTGARDSLAHSVLPEAADAVRRIASALEKTAVTGSSVTTLIEQLTLLKNTLADPTVAAAAQERGGPEASIDLTAAISALGTATRPAKRGTPVETERLNFYDGIIVEKARLARKAARAAARKLGQPAIAAAFALDWLDGHAPAKPPSPPAAPSPPA